MAASEQTDNKAEASPSKGNLLSKRAIAIQFLASTLCCFAATLSGFAVGFPSAAIPELSNPNSNDTLFMNGTELSLFGSISNLGGAAGALMAAAITRQLGQGIVLQLMVLISSASWIVIAVSPWGWLVNLARFGTGFGSGGIETSGMSYTAEVSHSSTRGSIGALQTVLRQAGYLFVYGLGASSLSWRDTALVCGLVVPIPTIIALFFMPKSPRWLVMSKNNIEAARKSFVTFRGKDYPVDKELNDVIKECDKFRDQNTSMFSQFMVLKSWSISRRMLAVIASAIVMQFMGGFAILSYAVPLFQLSGSSLDPYMSAVALGAIRLVLAAAIVPLVDKINRRMLNLIACICNAICLTGIAVFFYLKDVLQMTELVESLYWIPITGVIISQSAININNATLSLLSVEIFPSNARPLGASVGMTFFILAAFVVTLSYPAMIEAFDVYGTFFFYSGMSIVSGILPYIILVETRGKSLEQIEMDYRSREVVDKTDVKGYDNKGACNVD